MHQEEPIQGARLFPLTRLKLRDQRVRIAKMAHLVLWIKIFTTSNIHSFPFSCLLKLKKKKKSLFNIF